MQIFKFTDYKARLLMRLACMYDTIGIALLFQIEGLHIPYGHVHHSVAPFLAQAGVLDSFRNFGYNMTGRRLEFPEMDVEILVSFDTIEFVITKKEDE